MADFKIGKRFLNKLNKHLPCKDKEDVDEINALLYQMFTEVPDSNLYFGRELYIDCGCDDKKLKEFAKTSGKCMFRLTEDPIGHPGVTIDYKEDDGKY